MGTAISVFDIYFLFSADSVVGVLHAKSQVSLPQMNDRISSGRVNIVFDYVK